MRVFVQIAALLVALSAASAAQAFMLLQDELFPRAHFSERSLARTGQFLNAHLLSTVGVDAVETPSNEQTEKRIFAALGVAAQAAFNVGEKLRFDMRANALRSIASTEVTENSGWKKSESASELVAAAVARFALNDGLRVGGGATWVLRPAAVETFEFAQELARTEYSPYNLLAPEFMFSKENGSGWSAGLGWRPKATRQRSFRRDAASEFSEFNEAVVLDEQWSAGVVAQLQNSRQLSLDVNLHGVGETQIRDPKTGTTNDDGSRRRYELSGLLGLGDTGSHKMSFGLGYQSIGYTDQGNVSPQSIPLWTLLIRDELKWNDLNARLDALFGYGTDTQSLPDLNAHYRRIIVSVQAGVLF